MELSLLAVQQQIICHLFIAAAKAGAADTVTGVRFITAPASRTSHERWVALTHTESLRPLKSNSDSWT